ncbi:MAG: DUF6445 family protein [Dokdonella sp.]|uniref:DUF6445 family protein n=1 Tax=Dokdonella sp. TaxID=2291710 RepID=UPI003265CA97
MDRVPLGDSRHCYIVEDALRCAARHGIAAGYMTGSNRWFNQTASVPARWNRMIFYDGAVLHSGDIGAPEKLDGDPGRGRLTLNGFFVSRRHAA